MVESDEKAIIQVIRKKVDIKCNISAPPTFATMNSASSGLSSNSLRAISASEIRAYDKLIMRTPVLMTLCRRRTMRVYVPSVWKRGP